MNDTCAICKTNDESTLTEHEGVLVHVPCLSVKPQTESEERARIREAQNAFRDKLAAEYSAKLEPLTKPPNTRGKLSKPLYDALVAGFKDGVTHAVIEFMQSGIVLFPRERAPVKLSGIVLFPREEKGSL